MVELTGNRLDVGRIAKFNHPMHHRVMSKRIAVVGAGFCGSVLAANLLRNLHGPGEVLLLDRSGVFGRGLAYAARDYPYLLNVPAGRLSADSREPLQFLSFARQSLPATDAEDFLPRRLYGDYLEHCLRLAERAAPAHVQLTRLRADVRRIAAGSGADAPLTLELDGGAPLRVDQVVLALGNPPPRSLPGAAALTGHPGLFDDPWSPPSTLTRERAVLIVGNGLTMADVVSYLARDPAQCPRLITVSRRGLIPLTQSAFHSAAVRGGAEFFAEVASMRELLTASRRLAREVMELGGDWREVVTFIRAAAPMLWQRLAESERRRFLRHVQGLWDVHRHRLPLAIAARLAELRSQGIMSVNAGQIIALSPEGERVRVTWRRRGEVQSECFRVDAVINATGPDYSLERSGNGLLQSLREDGWIAADSLNLGLRTGANGACVGADGRVHERLFYLGPMLRAGHWEATAVPELRNHAEALARHLVRVNR